MYIEYTYFKENCMKVKNYGINRNNVYVFKLYIYV